MTKEEVLALAERTIVEVRAKQEREIDKVKALADSMGEPVFLEAVEGWLLLGMEKHEPVKREHIRNIGKTINDLVGWYRGYDLG